ncbi:MAG: signal peptidase II [Planctomycetes bacterium]|nr:signal peptidase II [Planctomycetota bacterium]
MRMIPGLTKRFFIFCAIAAAGCALDLWTKHWVFDWLGYPSIEPHWLWTGHVGLQTSLNRGALFGIGNGQVWLFVTLSILTAAGIVYWLFVRGAARDGVLNIALAVIMAGILGNLYDRLGLWSHPGLEPDQCRAVRDWILVQYDNNWVWPNFNVADSMLVGGSCALFLFSLRRQPLMDDAE